MAHVSLRVGSALSRCWCSRRCSSARSGRKPLRQQARRAAGGGRRAAAQRRRRQARRASQPRRGITPTAQAIDSSGADARARCRAVVPSEAAPSSIPRPHDHRLLEALDRAAAVGPRSRTRRVLYEELVAHGQGSGGNLPTKFSNQPDSHQTSLGLFLTEDTYVGRNGYSLRLEGSSAASTIAQGARHRHARRAVCERRDQQVARPSRPQPRLPGRARTDRARADRSRQRRQPGVLVLSRRRLAETSAFLNACASALTKRRLITRFPSLGTAS